MTNRDKRREKKWAEEKKDRNIARFCAAVLLIYGIIRISTVSSEARSVIWMGILFLPWYARIVLIPLTIKVLWWVFKLIAFATGIDSTYKDEYEW